MKNENNWSNLPKLTDKDISFNVVILPVARKTGKGGKASEKFVPFVKFSGGVFGASGKAPISAWGFDCSPTGENAAIIAAYDFATANGLPVSGYITQSLAKAKAAVLKALEKRVEKLEDDLEKGETAYCDAARVRASKSYDGLPERISNLQSQADALRD